MTASDDKILTLEAIDEIADWGEESFAEAGHSHDASDIATGALPVARGGTGATTAKAARRNLGIHTDLAWGDIKQALTWGQLRDG